VHIDAVRRLPVIRGAPIMIVARRGRAWLGAPLVAIGRPALRLPGALARHRLTILSKEAAPADQIDAEAARAELLEAQARQTTDARTAKEREDQMARARAKQATVAAK